MSGWRKCRDSRNVRMVRFLGMVKCREGVNVWEIGYVGKIVYDRKLCVGKWLSGKYRGTV
ncbi:38_t:CDS:2 [Cetraspora pellucida]|uniref:38_t:CDS:1 n=1 Tax=Cetraspora pellucida TaxID=1433469 RepID=A0ACA9KRJ5_9GLOM|nr:38_t:CDS:2 [Cetraspora pellucida]